MLAFVLEFRTTFLEHVHKDFLADFNSNCICILRYHFAACLHYALRIPWQKQKQKRAF